MRFSIFLNCVCKLSRYINPIELGKEKVILSSKSNYDVCKSKKAENFNGIKCMFANSQQLLQ